MKTKLWCQCEVMISLYSLIKRKSCGLWYIAIVLVTQWQIPITSLHLALSQSVLDENGLPNIRAKQASHSGGKFG